MVDIPVNLFIRGIDPISFHPYCTYAEVASARSNRSGTVWKDFKVENELVKLADVDYPLRLPIKQVNAKSGVLFINGVLFLAEEFPKGNRAVVRPLFLAAKDCEALLAVKDGEGGELFPRVELAPEQLELLTTELFGQAVSWQHLTGIVEKFQQGNLTVKIGDRFLNTRLLELSQLSFELRQELTTIVDIEERSKMIYQEILAAGAAPAELLEYASRTIKIRNFIYGTLGNSAARSFSENTDIDNCLKLLGGAGSVGQLPLRMQYLLIDGLCNYTGGFAELAQQLVQSVVSEQNFERVKCWQPFGLTRLTGMLVNNIRVGLLDALPDRLWGLLSDRNLREFMLVQLMEPMHEEIDLIDKKFREHAKIPKQFLWR